MRERECRKLTLYFGVSESVFLGLAALLVFLIDPFFHYHEPWFGLAAVQDFKEYQVPGVIEHVNYDSVLFGSSDVMSINTDILDARFSCKTVKAVGNSANAPFLHYYLERAFRTHDVQYVFYGLDVFSFYNDPNMDVITDDVKYLTNRNPFDDVKYLWNGEVIGKKIVDMIRTSRAGNYSWGNAYNFNQYGVCGPDAALSSCGAQVLQDTKQQPWDYQWEYVDENISRLERVIAGHPGTEFYFCLPPYPILFWVRSYNEGLIVSYEHTLRVCMERLLQYDNVKIYATDFNEVSVITDLYQYMDVIHGGPSVTDRMAWQIGDTDQEITLENYEEEMDELLRILEYFTDKVQTEGYGFLYETGGMKME